MRRAALALVAALVAAATAVLGHVALDHDDHRSTTGAHPVPRVLPGRVVHVATGERSTTFLPLGPVPSDGRTLSAQRAYNLLVSDTPKLQLIPSTVQPYYGVLTDRDGGQGAVRVWAFASESGCRRDTQGRCRLWEFVDATTGRDLGVVTQEVLPD